MLPSSRLRLHLVLPFHQPLSASQTDIAAVIQHTYAPLLTAMEATPAARLSLHFGGHLLDYLARHDEKFLLRVKDLRKKGQVEVLSGLFYGGLTGHLPEQDVRGQIEMGHEFWESFLGETPSGFWLSELSWSKELPRMFAQTGLQYGFVSDSQLHPTQGDFLAAGMAPSFGRVERAGHAVSAFVLEPTLSTQLPCALPATWLAAAHAAAACRPHHTLATWLRAEAMQPLAHADGAAWLKQFLGVLSNDPKVEMCLPEASHLSMRPAVAPLRLRHIIATELQPTGEPHVAAEFADFAFLYSEVDLLQRRMMRVTLKLHGAIGVMEDEELEESWSDSLATAQRLVFAALCPDAYWRGLAAGFSDPALRDATTARLQRAENMLDALLQGKEAWMSYEEQDLDGDLAEEVFVATAAVQAWVAPQRGGQIYTLDDRLGERNVLDVGSRRAEPFFAEVQRAQKKRSSSAGAAQDPLPLHADAHSRRGIRQFWGSLDVDASAALCGTAANALQAPLDWEVGRCGIDEDGDCSFSLELEALLPVGNSHGKNHSCAVQVQRRLHMPLEAPQLQLHTALTPHKQATGTYALEIPVRLGGATPQLTVNGELHTALSPTTFASVQTLTLRDAAGQGLDLHFATPTAVWCMALHTTVRKIDGFCAMPQGLILMPHVRVTGACTLDVRLTVVR
jgi:hypothetical protein